MNLPSFFSRSLALLMVVGLALLWSLSGCFVLTLDEEWVVADTAVSVSTPQPAIPAQIGGLPVILRADLPPDAHTTLDLIQRGGPFPYRQDDSVFQNRERLLPLHPRGYYREYTVETPGASTRGARRFVVGQGGEFYYTADHYASFSRVWDP